MKALIITAIASFFALSASAQVSTGTSATTPDTKLSKGAKADMQRPLRVAKSDTPPANIQYRSDAEPADINKNNVDRNPAAVDKVTPVSTLTEGPASGNGVTSTTPPANIKNSRGDNAAGVTTPIVERQKPTTNKSDKAGLRPAKDINNHPNRTVNVTKASDAPVMKDEAPKQ